eukprot:scaffold149714_cov37-Tisochrysis_lutea.AAC.1
MDSILAKLLATTSSMGHGGSDVAISPWIWPRTATRRCGMWALIEPYLGRSSNARLFRIPTRTLRSKRPP